MKRELFRPSYQLTYWVLGLSVLLAAAVLVLTVTVAFSPLQRHYLVTYLLTALVGAGEYRLLVVKRATGKYLATGRDVVSIPPDSLPATEIAHLLTSAAHDSGAQGLVDRRRDRPRQPPSRSSAWNLPRPDPFGSHATCRPGRTRRVDPPAMGHCRGSQGVSPASQGCGAERARSSRGDRVQQAC